MIEVAYKNKKKEARVDRTSSRPVNEILYFVSSQPLSILSVSGKLTHSIFTTTRHEGILIDNMDFTSTDSLQEPSGVAVLSGVFPLPFVSPLFFAPFCSLPAECCSTLTEML